MKFIGVTNKSGKRRCLCEALTDHDRIVILGPGIGMIGIAASKSAPDDSRHNIDPEDFLVSQEGSVFVATEMPDALPQSGQGH